MVVYQALFLPACPGSPTEHCPWPTTPVVRDWIHHTLSKAHRNIADTISLKHGKKKRI
jgi:hypothetical protein